MRLFFHHVGQKGADEDFKKTVYKDVSIQTVESNVPVDYQLLNQLEQKFPTGLFNCWGVPAGAKSVIRQLAAGDVVLLVHTATEYGQVPVLCDVQVFWPHELRDLSFALWGNDKYPYVFFFHTEELTLSWPELREHLSYAPNFDPRGNFYSVASHRLDDFGGVAEYVEGLRENYTVNADILAPVTQEELYEVAGGENLSVGEVNNTPYVTEHDLQQTPALTDESIPVPTQVNTTPRDAQFRILVRRIYDASCAICGSNLCSPDGKPEVQSAHIYPKALSGRDDPRNGLCLCHMHHWAFDAGWMSLSDDHTVLVRSDLPVSEEYSIVRQYMGEKIALPADERLAPHPVFMQAHRGLKGFS